MSSGNSYAELIYGTLDALLVDCASEYPDLAKELRRDSLRLSSALKSHGIRFALDVMPAYRKHFDKCLDERRLTQSHMLHFGSWERGGVIPRLFRGLTLRVFERTGDLKPDPDVNAVRWIRQLLGVVRKLRVACNIKDSGNAVIDFIETDRGIRKPTLNWADYELFDEHYAESLSFLDLYPHIASSDQLSLFDSTPLPLIEPQLLDHVQRTADLITATVGSFDPVEWRFRHGPGAVSDQPMEAYKYDFHYWPKRLEYAFPFADFAVANYALANSVNSYDKADYPAFLQEKPARLHAVPKTISKPRLIAAEPTCLQWCQQSIRDFLYHRVSHTILSNFIDFRRQEKNGMLALEASRCGQLVTIDLSEASDRISCWHVERLFRRSPSLLRSLEATRSLWLQQDICSKSPQYLLLRKYSTMGNATTFPVQSLFFLTLALASTLYARKQRVSYSNLRSLGSRQVRVFGDDIIVPLDGSGVLLDLLRALSLKVNVRKTFTEGNFRESCGVDAFLGHDVTTVNVLDDPVRTKPGSIASSVDVHHNLCDRGYFNTAAFLRKTVTDRITNVIRTVGHRSGLFGWSDLEHIPDNSGYLRRYNRDLQILEVKCLVPTVKTFHSPPEGNAGLLQYFTEALPTVTSAFSTLGHMTRRPKVRLSLRWVPAS